MPARERELKVTEIAEWEAEGIIQSEQIFHSLCNAALVQCKWTSSVEGLGVVSFSLSVICNSQLMNRVAMCDPSLGKVMICCITRL
jgi:hypothetical protein